MEIYTEIPFQFGERNVIFFHPVSYGERDGVCCISINMSGYFGRA